MAAQTQTIVVPPTVFPFEGQPPGGNNIYPRARILFEDKTAITAKMAGDTNTVSYTLTLPRNYAYRIDQFLLCLFLASSVDVDNFDALGLYTVQLASGVNSLRGEIQSLGVSVQTTVAGAAQQWAIPPQNRFGEVFWNTDGSSPQVIVEVYDTDGTNNTDALAALNRFTFLQYDIQQVNDVRVNAPQPVTVV